ncbi:hypothetical protein BSZ36_15330 [Rubricoccus marinus]|uniref:Curlin n=2 Tax=Rubricoccus marinus TaxID=716817 RepID=A0A259U2M7_9BACT|nr:hypothetical protein BSZ36_15330 [Rubricoccus marinus]
MNIRGFDSASNDALSLPNSNDYVVNQEGFKNRANVMAGGSDNLITIIQDGDQNIAGRDGQAGTGFLLVDGDLNTVSVSQTGNFHRAGVSVVGDNNTSTITQN